MVATISGASSIFPVLVYHYIVFGIILFECGMGISSATVPHFDECERRIDRSGDIDQRRHEELTGGEMASVLSFPRAGLGADQQHQMQHYVPAVSSEVRARAAPAGLAELAQSLQKNLDKQYAKARSALETL